MNTLDIYFERGIEKGIAQGIEKGIAQGIEIGIEKGIEKGIVQGIEKGREEGKEQIVQNLIRAGKFTMSEIANLAGVPEAFVKKVNTFMKKKN